MQDDALIGNLTVEETLNYSLRLRVPAKEANQEQRNLRIDALLADLNLTKVRKSRVSAPHLKIFCPSWFSWLMK